jgi:hypothetical protein
MQPILESFKDVLQSLREKHIKQKNTEVHAAIKKIVDDAIKTIDIESIKERFIKKVKEHPGHNSYEESFTISLDDLFTEHYNWVDNKLIKNSKEPLELWFYDKKNILHKYIFNKDTTNTSEFCDYLYSSNADIQGLKNIFKKAFPDAAIKPWIFIHPNSKSHLRISIIYELGYKLQNVEPFVEEPYRKIKGDFVTW